MGMTLGRVVLLTRRFARVHGDDEKKNETHGIDATEVRRAATQRVRARARAGRFGFRAKTSTFP
jgi:hypothetical protein